MRTTVNLPELLVIDHVPGVEGGSDREVRRSTSRSPRHGSAYK